ncbi:ketoisovalerate reductase [Ophiostoma piceae UAMH 11346]|uniref:Ketoisovalerate reductase n=1 Tax=Ophiostoma piceae (strain UAMH 11346) TaxID=1262450 RepID=S3BLQ0_OPHP1|nr:ketoisovalerate reductase [Ophiostoma piceae UAMH 11346]
MMSARRQCVGLYHNTQGIYKTQLSISRSLAMLRRCLHSTPVKHDSAMPEWLAKILNDKADAPKLYRWTAKDHAQSEGVISAMSASSNRSDDARERVYIVGIGNLGRLFAAALARVPNPPLITLVVHRAGLLESWNEKPGLRLHSQSYVKDGRTDSDAITDLDVEMWAPSPEGRGHEIGPISNLIVATKAQDALPAVDRLRRYLSPDSAIVFTQNGMNKLWPPYGAIYSAARYTKSPNWVACVVTHGVFSLGPFESVHASPADVVLGSVNNNTANHERPYLVQKLLEASVLNSRWVPRADLWVMQVEKLVVNAVINPLTAILRCKNGLLFGYGEDGSCDNLDDSQGAVLRQIIDQLLEEASTVLTALAIVEMKDGGVLSHGVMEKSALVERLSLERLRAMVYRVGGVVRLNTSSMLQDVNASKGTEVREFNGWVVDMARYLESMPGAASSRFDVTTHKAMVSLVEGGHHLSKDKLGEYV